MLDRKHARFLISIVLIELINICFAASANNSYIIQNNGTIRPYVIAKSGSAIDIQAAVNTANSAGGGTVVIPAGTWVWSNPSTSSTEDGPAVIIVPEGVNIIGSPAFGNGSYWAGCSSHPTWTPYNTSHSIIIKITNPVPSDSGCPILFYVNGHTGDTKSTRISGIEFICQTPTQGGENDAALEQNSIPIVLWEAQNFRVDHCTFENASAMAVFADACSSIAGDECYGVIDHCIVNDTYKLTTPTNGVPWVWGYGFYSRGNGFWRNNNWDNQVQDFAGKYQPIANCTLMYVEDCSFDYCRHCTDTMACGWNVVRFNVARNAYVHAYGGQGIGYYDSHGTGNQAYGNNYGGRGMECYNNTIYGVNGSAANDNSAFRLRGGSAIIFNNTYYATDASSCFVLLDNCEYSTMYPYTNINQTYVWSNYVTGTSNIIYVLETQAIYYTRAPSLALDGWTYTPYQYPLPRTLV